MAIKGGQIVQVGNSVLLDRIQTGGPGQVNVPQTQIYELGNYESLGFIYDIPDITYALDSADARATLEALLVGSDFATDAAGTAYDLGAVLPLDTIGQFTSGLSAADPYATIGSAAAPYLMPESISYSFDLTNPGSIQGSLRGDSVFYNRGSMYTELLDVGSAVHTVTNKALTSNVATLTIGTHTIPSGTSVVVAGVDSTFNGTFTLTAVTSTTISYAKTAADVASVSSGGTVDSPGTGSAALANNAYPYNGDLIAGTKYALSVAGTDGQRFRFGVDYTETVTGSGVSKAVTIVATGTITLAPGAKLRVTYASDTVAEIIQADHTVASAVAPSAVKGRNIVVKVGGVVWTDVQSVKADWKITLDKDEEFGNDQVVSQDFDVPTTSGSVSVKPRNPGKFFDKLKAVTGVSTDTEVMGALQRVPQTLEIILYSPVDGTVLKTLYIADAKFSVPGYSGKVNSKTSVDFSWSSDSGSFIVYKGAKP